MKTAIVYYSLTGNSRYAATSAARRLGADLIRLAPVKAYPDSGFRKYFWGGKSAVMGEEPELEPYEFDADEYGRVIFCFPVWAGSPAPPIRTFIKENKGALKGKRCAALLCFSGGGDEKALAKLRALLGVNELEAELVLVDPRDRSDASKDKAIEDFCKELKRNDSNEA